MTTKYIVNNVSGQTINGEPILRPYKVYTALLTQSGGSSQVTLDLGQAYPEPAPASNISKGVTYLIFNNNQNYDFTSIGAPNNNVDTYFVANQTLLIESVSAILKYDEGAPVVTVLENTIGNIWFSYYTTGLYFINSDSLFISDKTFITGSMWGDDSASPRFFGGYYSDQTSLIFGNGSVNDNLQIYLEIRVYN